MKQFLHSKISLLICLLLANACSRSINGIPLVRVKKEKQVESISLVVPKQTDENLTASVDESAPVNADKKFIVIEKNYSSSFESTGAENNAVDCDTIIFKTGVRIVVRITGTDNSEIKYKFCNDLNGETYKISQSKVLMVKYASAPQINNTVVTNPIKSDTAKSNNGINEPKQPEIIFDTLFFRSGQRRGVTVAEISQHEIKYKDSDNPDGPIYSANKSAIELIKYSNGKTEVFPIENYQDEKKSKSSDAGTGLTIALIGCCLPPIAIVGLIMNIVALNQINKHPEKYDAKEKRTAIGGIVLGIIEVAIITLIILAIAL